ncbi:MAG: cupin domain-containing protein [Rhodanobacter sp.]
MPRINIETVPERRGSNYPSPFADLAGQRVRRALGNAGGLGDFGVNLSGLPPGAWSSQRHWHTREDEFVYVLAGEVTLVTDAGEQLLRAGDCAAFPKNVADGHHLINRSDTLVTYLEIGTRADEDICHYPDIDLHCGADGQYAHKDGSAY